MKNIIGISLLTMALAAPVAQARDLAFYNNSGYDMEVAVYDFDHQNLVYLDTVVIQRGQIVIKDVETRGGSFYPVIGEVKINVENDEVITIINTNNGNRAPVCSADANEVIYADSEIAPGLVELSFVQHLTVQDFSVFDCDYAGSVLKGAKN